ncbi:hypothetical protein AOXY_G30599 [Acipenser oxyrinchus oxyrinchus]|uniref:Secreted protein n=1 Tax=Acipenser oxyrinchus oxyrinchus TaxID=40147 RepID=A0AAD8FQ04_ACIOX|nr:hypothetical protein AOXY_G30599 [Acipenser oxyrinchus oxyrinchus]
MKNKMKLKTLQCMFYSALVLITTRKAQCLRLGSLLPPGKPSACGLGPHYHQESPVPEAWVLTTTRKAQCLRLGSSLLPGKPSA